MQMLNVAKAQLCSHSTSLKDLQAIALDIESLEELNKLSSGFHTIRWISDIFNNCHYQLKAFFHCSVSFDVFKIDSLDWIFPVELVISWFKNFLFDVFDDIVYELLVE